MEKQDFFVIPHSLKTFQDFHNFSFSSQNTREGNVRVAKTLMFGNKKEVTEGKEDVEGGEMSC